MVEAEEGARIEARTATREVAAKKREAPNASQASGIDSTQFCQFVYSKPGALFSVNRIQTLEPREEVLWSVFFGRAMVWKSRTN
jgi:hypothetical protein